MTDYSRRRVLAYAGAAVVTVTVGGLGWTRAIAQSATSASNGATDADSMGPPASPAFTSLAKALTGAQDANPLLIQRVYQELSARYADLDTVAPLLTSQIAAHTSGPFSLSDAHQQEVYTQTLQGIYLGVVGPAKTPKCIAFEDIVSYKVVAGAVSPPTYCSGQPGFWVNKPAHA